MSWPNWVSPDSLQNSSYYTLTRWGAMYRPFLTTLLGFPLTVAALIFAFAYLRPGESLPVLGFLQKGENMATLDPAEGPPPPRTDPPKVGATPVEAPAPATWGAEIRSRAGEGSRVIFPAGPADFAAIGDETVRDVWDLREWRRVGSIGPVGISSMAALSPDGTTLAGPTADRRSLLVVSTRDGSELIRLDIARSGVDLLAFAGPDRLVIANRTNRSLRAWEIPSGRPVLEASLPADMELENLCVAPDGRHLAGTERKDQRLAVIDLGTGQATTSGALAGPDHSPMLAVRGLAFNPDGSELAAIVEPNFDRARIVTWDLAAANAAEACELPYGTARAWRPRMEFSRGPKLEYLRDEDGWLIAGSYVLLRRECRLIRPSAADSRQPYQPRRVLTGGRMAVVVGDSDDAEGIRGAILPR